MAGTALTLRLAVMGWLQFNGRKELVILKIRADIVKRFAELEHEMQTLEIIKGDFGPHVEEVKWQKWASRVIAVLDSTFSRDSRYSQNFEVAYKNCRGYASEIEPLKGIFLGAKDDIDAGYLHSVETLLSGEFFGDFLVMAKKSLVEGHKDVAAVLASAALEDVLKKYARLHDLDVDDKVMQDVVNALKSKGLVTGPQKSLLDIMPKIRDYAMHANWEKITPQDVGSLIGYVEQFLLTYFSD